MKGEMNHDQTAKIDTQKQKEGNRRDESEGSTKKADMARDRCYTRMFVYKTSLQE